jgi:hypothetical protein
VFQRFRQAKFAYGGSILSSSQFLLLIFFGKNLPNKNLVHDGDHGADLDPFYVLSNTKFNDYFLPSSPINLFTFQYRIKENCCLD